MEELQKLAGELNDYLENKESKLNILDSYTIGNINNVRNEISSFEQHVKLAERNPVHKKEIIKNFTRKANEIKLKIDGID